MADVPPYRDRPKEAAEPDDTSTRAPRWVKVSAAIALAVIVVLAAMFLLGGGDHGPGRHFGGHTAGGEAREGALPAAAPGGHEPPAWAPEH